MKKIMYLGTLGILVMLVISFSSVSSQMTTDKVEITIKGGFGGPKVEVYNGEDHSINAICTVTVGSTSTVHYCGSGGVVPGGATDKGCLKQNMKWNPAVGFTSGIFARGTIKIQAGNLTVNAGVDKITVTKTGFVMFGFCFLR